MNIKKIPVLVIGAALMLAAAGCGGKGASATVTEDTDPAQIKGEAVERAAWQSAFTPKENYGVKSVLNLDVTQNDHTMSATVSLVYHFTEENAGLSLSMKEGADSFEAEAYVEYGEGGAATMWQRSKDDGAWTEWEQEECSAAELGSVMGAAGDLTLLKDAYANFSYSDVDRGYTLTTSGLAAMQATLGEFALPVLSQIIDDVTVTAKKLVVKLSSGDPAALLLDLKLEEQTENEATMSEGEGSDPQETPAPMQASAKISQIYFDFGKTVVSRPAELEKPAEPSAEGTPTRFQRRI